MPILAPVRRESALASAIRETLSPGLLFRGSTTGATGRLS